jgi:hypothetical protein
MADFSLDLERVMVKSSFSVGALVIFALCLVQVMFNPAQSAPQLPNQSGLKPVVDENQVAINGSGFNGTTSVTFDGVAVAFIVVSDTLITATRPSGIKDQATVELKTPGGMVSFVYVRPTESQQAEESPKLELVSVEPAMGPASGGTVLRIKGSGFRQRGNLRVTLDGNDATSVSRVREDELLAVTPAHEAGVVKLAVKTLDGKEVVLDRAFTFIAPPALATVTPSIASTAGGTAIQLQGQGFSTAGEVKVMFGNASATQVTVKSGTEIIAIAPPYGWGPVDLQVTNADGQSALVKAAITYVVPPSITSVGSATGLK